MEGNRTLADTALESSPTVMLGWVAGGFAVSSSFSSISVGSGGASSASFFFLAMSCMLW